VKKFFIIDGNSYIHRAFHALPFMVSKDGFPTNALYGFTRMLLKIIDKEKPYYIVVCFDRPEPTFRHKEFKDYKATRPEIEMDLKKQIKEAPLIPEALGIRYIAEPGFEADDIICGMVNKFKKEDIEIYIVSSDKDTYQLVGDGVFIYNEMKDMVIGEREVKKIFGVKPEQIIDFLALTGDSSDNVPGVKGIGPKTAVNLLKKFNSVEDIYNRIDEIEEKIKEKLLKDKEKAFLSLKLVKLEPVNIDFFLKDFIYKGPNKEKARQVFEKFEFKSLLKNFIPELRYDGKGRIIEDKEELVKIREEIERKKEMYLIYDKHKNLEIFGIKAEKTYIIKFGGEIFLSIKKNDLKIFKDVFENEKIKKSSTNMKNVYKFLRSLDIELKGVHFDLDVISYLINPAKSNETGELFEEYLKKKIVAEDIQNRNFIFLENLNEMEKKLLEKLKDEEMTELYFEMELPLIEILVKMEDRGIKVDKEFFKEFSEKIKSEIESAKKEIFEFTGESCNINSPKQIAFVLFEKLKLPIIKKGKTGPSTSEEVLKELSNVHPLPELILKYRELQKLHSTYIEPLYLSADKNSRVHPNFNQTKTQTGRLSSSNPNLQNIPVRSELAKEIRRGFIAEEGYEFVSFDYSQIDLRVLAHYSEDENLIEAFKNNGDIHTETAKEIFGKKEISTRERRIAKTVNFGIVYGMSPFGLSRDLGIPKDEAKEYIDRYFRRYKGVKDYIERTIKDAKLKGFVKTLFGRKRYISEFDSSRKDIISYGERIAVNTPIQGTSADIIKIAMIKMNKFIEKNELDIYLLLQIHDELLFEVKEDLVEEFIKNGVNIMENCVKLRVPVKVDYKKGRNWYEIG